MFKNKNKNKNKNRNRSTKTSLPKLGVAISLLFFVSGCNQSDIASGSGLVDPFPTGMSAVAPSMTGNNILPVEVNTLGYLNEPVVTLTICNPGTAGTGAEVCRTIDRVLLDTGSSGLRIFGSLISGLTLTQMTTAGGKNVAKCTNYADGTAQWGPVKSADLKLGGETVFRVNVQVIDANYAIIPTIPASGSTPASSDCDGAENDPTLAGYNGILGVGVLDRDCGSLCVSSSAPKLYFTCNSSSSVCISDTVALALQVQNPVAAMTASSTSDNIDDSNGSALILPSIPSTGAATALGYLVFGVGTRSNNVPGATATVFKTNENGYFTTTYAGRTLNSFIDSGSNGLFFPATSQNPTCSNWFCPTKALNLTATQVAYTGGSTKAVSFQIINAEQVFVSQNYAYSNLGGEMLMATFDWGLPFFFGRTIYTGIRGKSATINGVDTGTTWPYYAY
jgi:hypothetical protein